MPPKRGSRGSLTVPAAAGKSQLLTVEQPNSRRSSIRSSISKGSSNNNINTRASSFRDNISIVSERKEDYVPIDPELVEKSGLTEQAVRELREIFSLVDEDGGGTIDKDELGGLLRSLGIKATKTELENIIDEIDINKTGEIEFEAFVLAMAKKPSTTHGSDSLIRAFRMFETDHSLITYDKLVSVLCEVGEPDQRLSKEDAEEYVLGVAPQIKDGPLQYEQFLQMLFQ